jgi:hypothetical protein
MEFREGDLCFNDSDRTVDLVRFLAETCTDLRRELGQPTLLRPKDVKMEPIHASPDVIRFALHALVTPDPKWMDGQNVPGDEPVSPSALAAAIRGKVNEGWSKGEKSESGDPWLDGCGVLFVFYILAGTFAALEIRNGKECTPEDFADILQSNVDGFHAIAVPQLDDGEPQWEERVRKACGPYTFMTPFSNA